MFSRGSLICPKSQTIFFFLNLMPELNALLKGIRMTYFFVISFSFSSSSGGIFASSIKCGIAAEGWRGCFPGLVILILFFSSMASLLSDLSDTTEGAPPRVSVFCGCEAAAVTRPEVSLSLLFSAFFSLVSCPFFAAPGPPCCPTRLRLVFLYE